MADINFIKEGATIILAVNGELTIENASELGSSLLKAIEEHGHTIMDLSNVTSMDLSCLQLICSAHRTSVNAEKSFELKSGIPEVLKQVVRESGYSRDHGCTKETLNKCLWKGI